MKPYRIGFVTSELLPVTRGGAGMLLYLSAGELLRRGHQVHILLDAPIALADAFRHEHQAKLPDHRQFTLTAMAELLGSADPPGAGEASWYQKKSQQWYRAVEAWLKVVPLDVIEFPDFYGFGHAAIAAHRWLGLGGATQFAVRLHTTMEQLQQQEIGCYVDGAGLLMQEQERSALHNADAILAPSQSRARAVARDYDMRESQLIVSPPIVDHSVKFARQDRCDTVLFVGRLFHVKGADIFVDAAVHLLQRDAAIDPKVRFVLIGYDSKMGPGFMPFEQYLRRRIPARLADRFIFTGELKGAEVAQWLSRSICYVCPSRTESFGYTVHEAAAAGVPLILNDLDAFADFFQDGVNCLKFNGSASDLAGKISRILHEEQLAADLAQHREGEAPAEPNPLPEPGLGGSLGLPESYQQLAERARQPQPTAPSTAPTGKQIVAVILKTSSPAQHNRFSPAEKAIRQAWPAANIIHLEPADAASHQTVPLLGRLWSIEGEPVTSQLLMLCLESDRFDVECLGRACQAMMTQAALGAIAPFAVPDHVGDDYVPAPLDLELSLWPILHQQALTRCLMRTPPNWWLGDLFDRRVESYGEIDYLWQLQDQNLSVFQWPSAGAVLAETDILLDNGAIFESMLLRNRNIRRMTLQSRFLPQLVGKTTPPLTVGPQAPNCGHPSALRKVLNRIKRGLRRFRKTQHSTS